MVGFAHSLLLLLQYPDFTKLTENTSSSTLFTGDSTELKIQQDFDRTEDNPAKYFITSFLSTYNWLSGNFLQQDAWNFWPVKVITFIGSILLVTILQNMFIAFMGGVFTKAYEKGHVTFLRFCAALILDYEALDEIYFSPPSPEPKYIYYIDKSISYNEWEMVERNLTYEDDDDSSESEKQNETTSVKEFNNEVKKEKEKEIIITERDNKVVKEEDININELNKKINDLNNKINDNNSRNDELNSKINKLFNAINGKFEI
ncbi:2237_t:CDS:2 [Funneliformis caledonium]|uniref:2237_t:CDS:1 n=1 Tax=Funneliformis caledonium TaxID=1117310 RepID=A0A9N8VY32_9GLOM|nr:2237_t:CDS:2 [Funneliformis caledonium]